MIVCKIKKKKQTTDKIAFPAGPQILMKDVAKKKRHLCPFNGSWDLGIRRQQTQLAAGFAFIADLC